MEAYISPVTSSPRNDDVLVGDRHLNDMPVPFDGHCHLDFGILGEIPLQLADLLVDEVAQVIGYFDVFFGD
jgi:hypothetical protein